MTNKASAVGMRASMKPKPLKEGKKSKVFGFSVPKLGRFAFSRDNGEADLFFREMVSTNLRAIHRAADRSVRGAMQPGEILGEYDLGSGKVTNVGVTSLANDSNWQANTTENLATLNLQKFMNWGIGTAEGEAYNWKLETQSEVEGGTKKEAIAVTTSVLKYLAGGSSKIIITGTLEEPNAGPVAITEWGIFSAAKTEGTALVANTSTTATELNDTAVFKIAPGTSASAKDVRGAQGYVVAVPGAEPEANTYGLILSNTTAKVVIPAWIKNGSAATAVTPTSTSAKYGFFPVMFDRRKFAAINVEKGNKIEFPYELEI